MWDIPRFRIRAYVKTLQERRKKAELTRPNFHFRRTEAQITRLGALGAGAEITHARVVLNDLRSTQITVFSSRPLAEDMKVAITLIHPERFYVKARVRYCRTYEISPRLMSVNTYPYRIRLEFIFDSEEERQSVERYCEYITGQYLPQAA